MKIVSTTNGSEAAHADNSIDCQDFLSVNNNNELSDVAEVLIDSRKLTLVLCNDVMNCKLLKKAGPQFTCANKT